MAHLNDCRVEVSDISRMWLHQANINMNLFAAQKIFGHAPTQLEAPIALSEYANTASAGAIVAFHKYHEDLAHSDKGLICSFGAGYSVGSLLVEKIEAGAD
jgi:beta-ketodecanoyl-[acyl-carrier-protein] synthase